VRRAAFSLTKRGKNGSPFFLTKRGKNGSPFFSLTNRGENG